MRSAVIQISLHTDIVTEQPRALHTINTAAGAETSRLETVSRAERTAYLAWSAGKLGRSE